MPNDADFLESAQKLKKETILFVFTVSRPQNGPPPPPRSSSQSFLKRIYTFYYKK